MATLPRVPPAAARLLARATGSGTDEARRALPIRRDPSAVRALWDDPAARAAVLDGVPATEATLAFGADARDGGIVTELTVRLDAPMPAPAAQALAGRAVRRLKALAESGEVPTKERNPSGREEAGR